MKISNKILFLSFVIVLTAIMALSILGIILMRDKDIVLQGQIEAEEYNISGLLPGRIEEIYVRKGDKVNKGRNAKRPPGGRSEYVKKAVCSRL